MQEVQFKVVGPLQFEQGEMHSPQRDDPVS